MENKLKIIVVLGILLLINAPQNIYAQFEPDTSINGKLFLLNVHSIKKEIGDLMPKLNKEKDLPDILFSNESGKQYLRLVFHPGSYNNAFSMFEVGYTSPQMKIKNKVKFDEFYTEKKIKLGMTKSKFMSILGNYVNKINGKSEYFLKLDNPKNPFLELYSLPAYEAKYIFKNNILVKFYFGFQYP